VSIFGTRNRNKGKVRSYRNLIIKTYYLKLEVYEDYIENRRGVIKLRCLIFWELLSRRATVSNKSLYGDTLYSLEIRKIKIFWLNFYSIHGEE
jgi:hypothetical protein